MREHAAINSAGAGPSADARAAWLADHDPLIAPGSARLFDKTGSKRQVDLVRLVAGLALPV